MNWFDLVVLGIVGAGALNGLTRGIIRQVLSIAGFVGGVFLAGQRYQVLASRLTFLPDPSVASVVAFAMIFVAAVVAANLLGQILQRVARLAMFGCADRVLGLVFGAAEAVVIVQLGLLLLLKFPLFGPLDFVSESTVGAVLLRYAALLFTLLPAEFNNVAKMLPIV